MTVLTSLDITIENPDVGDKKVIRDEDGMPLRSQVMQAWHGLEWHAGSNKKF